MQLIFLIIILRVVSLPFIAHLSLTLSDAEAVQYCRKLAECLEHLNRPSDFNIPDLFISYANSFSCSFIMSDFITKHALTQLVSSPTRYSSNSDTASMLDLVLCNDDHFIFNTVVKEPFDNSVPT